MNLMQKAFPMKEVDRYPSEHHLDHNEHVTFIATMLNEGSPAEDIQARLKILKHRYHSAAKRAIFEAIHFLRLHQYRFVAITARDLQKAKQQCDELEQTSKAATATDTTSTSAPSTETDLGSGENAVQDASAASETARQ